MLEGPQRHSQSAEEALPMRPIHGFLTLIAFSEFIALPVHAQDAEPPEIEWRDWDDALFQISEGTCSLPVFEPDALRAAVERITQ